MLGRHNAKHGPIVRLKDESCADQTSFRLIDLEIEFDDGRVMILLLKDLGITNLHETARQVKPGFLYDPLREIRTYEKILGRTASWHRTLLWGGRQTGGGSLLALLGEDLGFEA